MTGLKVLTVEAEKNGVMETLYLRRDQAIERDVYFTSDPEDAKRFTLKDAEQAVDELAMCGMDVTIQDAPATRLDAQMPMIAAIDVTLPESMPEAIEARANQFIESAIHVESLDAFCNGIQTIVGQDDGAIAGIVFSGHEDDYAHWREASSEDRMNLAREYLAAEKSNFDADFSFTQDDVFEVATRLVPHLAATDDLTKFGQAVMALIGQNEGDVAGHVFDGGYDSDEFESAAEQWAASSIEKRITWGLEYVEAEKLYAPEPDDNAPEI